MPLWTVCSAIACLLLVACGDGEESYPGVDGPKPSPTDGALDFRTHFQRDPCLSMAPPSAVPLETSVGHVIRITIDVIEDSDGQLSPVTWEADNGWTATGPSVQFPCTAVGTFRVAVHWVKMDASCELVDPFDDQVSPAVVTLTCSEP